MMRITSEDNKTVKKIAKLASRKYRDIEGLYIIEGENLFREALRNRAQIETVIVREDKYDFYSTMFGDELNDAYILTEQIFDRLKLTQTSQGIAAVVRKPSREGDDIDGNILVMDRLQDPGNIGTIIRTCDAAGYGAVMLIKGTADVYSPKVVRSAAGSLFRVRILEGFETADAVEWLKSRGYQITGTCFDTEYFYYDADLKDNIALVIGNEGNGMSDELLRACDMKIKIPMKGSIESLNASVAAGILIYETIRQERKK